MTALSNPKHERFAQELAKGKTADEAYVSSGLERVECGHHSGFYVYALVDPRTDHVFYIGKGKGKRYAAHHREWISGIIALSPEADQKLYWDIVGDFHSLATRAA